MSAFIYHPVSRVVPTQPEGARHWFGGEAIHKGTHPDGCPAPLHRFYDFDTQDPLCPIKLPTAERLPIYYGPPYNAGAIGYSVVSDNEIVVHYMETKKLEVDFPYPGYPKSFPRIAVRLVEVPYETQKILAFNHFVEQPQSGLRLSETDLKHLDSLSYPFTQLGGVHVMWQDIPRKPCPNPHCSTHSHGPLMDVFAVIWNNPVPGVYLWDDSEDGCDIQMICQVCRHCSSIYVCNRCT